MVHVRSENSQEGKYTVTPAPLTIPSSTRRRFHLLMTPPRNCIVIVETEPFLAVLFLTVLSLAIRITEWVLNPDYDTQNASYVLFV